MTTEEALFENGAYPLVFVNLREQTLVKSNGVFKEWFQLSDPDFSVLDFGIPVDEIIRELAEKSSLTDIPLRIRHSNGKEVECLSMIHQSGPEAGENVLLVVRDTNIRRNEKELLRNRFESILNSSADAAIIATDRTGIIRQFNRGASRMLGYDEIEVIGKAPLSSLFPPLFLGKMIRIMGSDKDLNISEKEIFPWLCRNGDLVRNREWLLRHSNGLSISVQLSLSPVLSDDDSYEGTLLIAQDITEMNRMREELNRAKLEAEEISRTKSSFLANMSHEIRTPLNGIIGLTDLLNHSEMTEQQHTKLTIIQKSANTLLNLINDILDYTRIEAGKFKLGDNPFSLKTLLDEIRDMLEVNIRERNISFAIDIDEKVFDSLIGDSRRIKQILINLIGNAMKFTLEGSICVEIGSIADSEKDETLLFRVKDTGIGISSEERSKLFQYFSQVDTSETRKYGGSGLGLAISRELVSMMGGKIGVESEPGRGSVFWFTVKLEKDQQNRNRAESITINPSEHSRLTEEEMQSANGEIRVLVAEDNKVNQLVAMNFMKKLGYKADLVENGKDAVEACRNRYYDVILMDQMMPVMDGIEATSEIRNMGKAAKNPEIIIIALTANALKGDREILLEAGMDDYIPKPVLLKDMKEVLERNLKAAK